MGIFSIIGTAFNFLFRPQNSGKGESLVQQGANIIDEYKFTNQEKAEFHTKLIDLWLQIKGESTTRAITRRLLAVGFCGSFLLFLIWSAIVWPFYKEWAIYILGMAKILSDKYIITSIIVFYFGPYAIGQYLWKKKEKNSNSPSPSPEKKEEKIVHDPAGIR